MTLPHPIVFLVGVDNTRVDNDAIQRDLMVELGYRDCIGALQNFRVERPLKIELLSMSFFLMDYPFADRLYALDAKVISALPPTDLTIERIGDLLDYDLARLRAAALYPA